MRLPVLHLTVPSGPCALFVNGTLCGNSADVPVLPVSPNGTIFITCLPIAQEENASILPLTVRLSLKDGLPDAPVFGCKLFLYSDGVMDVQLCPQLLPLSKAEQPYSASRTLFTLQGRPHNATLYQDNGWRIAIEDIGRDMLLICHHIRDFKEGRVQAVHCFSPSDVHVTGQGPHGPRSLLFTPIKGRYTLIADEDAYSTVANHTLVCTKPLHDTADHEMQYTLSFHEDTLSRSAPVFGHFVAKPDPVASPALICKALCEAVALSLEEEAFSYLTPDLADGMTLTDLFDFFGQFDHVHGVEGEGPFTLLLAQVLYENVFRLQSYVCEMEGLKIANILPQD